MKYRKEHRVNDIAVANAQIDCHRPDCLEQQRQRQHFGKKREDVAHGIGREHVFEQYAVLERDRSCEGEGEQASEGHHAQTANLKQEKQNHIALKRHYFRHIDN